MGEQRVGRAGTVIALGELEGMVKMVFDTTTGELPGAHMVGTEATALIQGVVARGLETTEADLMHTMFPHPTISETMHEAVLDAYGRVLHFRATTAPRYGTVKRPPVSSRLIAR